LQDVGAGLAQPALDLAEVGIRYPGRLRELANRLARLLALLPDVVTDAAHTLLCSPPGYTPSRARLRRARRRGRASGTHATRDACRSKRLVSQRLAEVQPEG